MQAPTVSTMRPLLPDLLSAPHRLPSKVPRHAGLGWDPCRANGTPPLVRCASKAAGADWLRKEALEGYTSASVPCSGLLTPGREALASKPVAFLQQALTTGSTV